MTIKDWAASERPREKLAEHGAGVLSDAELLAVILRAGHAGTTAIDLARSVLDFHGGLRQTLDCDVRALRATPGLGLGKAASLVAVVELARRYLEAVLKRGVALRSPRQSASFLVARMRHYRAEVFACIFLDTRHRVLRFEELFRGTIDGASVHPREIVRRSLELNAAAVICAHNHPSGVAEPSSADADITRRLRDALKLIDVRLLDHFIIGDGEPVSLAERGML